MVISAARNDDWEEDGVVVDATSRFPQERPVDLPEQHQMVQQWHGQLDEQHDDRDGRRGPIWVESVRTDQQPGGGALVLRAQGAMVRYRARRRELTPDQLVARAARRQRNARWAMTTVSWVGTRLWWVVRGVPVALRGGYRVVWQPEMAEIIATLKDTQPTVAASRRKDLRRERRIALLTLLGVGASGWVVYKFWGDELLAWAWQSTPGWALFTVGGLILLGLGYAGRPELGETAEQPAVLSAMPDGLAADASDRGVIANLNEAFADANLRAKVHGVQKAAGGWGWTATLEVLDAITEAKLEGLERYLNTPVGGLVLSAVTAAARVRTLRIVMQDLLANPIDSPERSQTSVRTPVELATRFDGGRLRVELFGRHILVVGRTASGKSGVLHDVVDALTSMGDCTVDGLDITGGPDLRAWEDSLNSYVGGPDFVKAEKLLAGSVAMVKDRTAQLGARYWDTEVDGPAHFVVIDEYGLAAEHPRLRMHVEYLITYGIKVGVHVVLCAQRKVKEMMKSALIASQVHVKIYLGMAAEDVASLPKSERDQGVRPQLFRQATRTDPGDAGKGFVIGLEPMPILARFDRTDRGVAARRSAERAPFRPQLRERDRLVVDGAEFDGVPQLVHQVRDAVLAIASESNPKRNPERASGEEISYHLGAQGVVIDKAALVRELRNATGGLITRSRDTNLAPGSNPKGFYLEDLDQAIATLRERARAASDQA
ncbi:hypothetical protein ACVDFE_00250 [Lentzea chajnantorensis]